MGWCVMGWVVVPQRGGGRADGDVRLHGLLCILAWILAAMSPCACTPGIPEPRESHPEPRQGPGRSAGCEARKADVPRVLPEGGGGTGPPSVPWVLLGGVQDLLGAPTSLGAALPGRMQRCVSRGVSPQNHGVCGWWGHSRATGPSLSQISVAAWLPATFIVVRVPWIGS